MCSHLTHISHKAFQAWQGSHHPQQFADGGGQAGGVRHLQTDAHILHNRICRTCLSTLPGRCSTLNYMQGMGFQASDKACHISWCALLNFREVQIVVLWYSIKHCRQLETWLDWVQHIMLLNMWNIKAHARFKLLEAGALLCGQDVTSLSSTADLHIRHACISKPACRLEFVRNPGRHCWPAVTTPVQDQ